MAVNEVQPRYWENLVMAPKHKSSDAGNSDMPKKSHQALV